MLSVGQQKVKDGGFSQIELPHGNAMELPLMMIRLIMSRLASDSAMSLIT